MSRLRELRTQQFASLREQASKIGIAVGTLLAAEHGKPLRADTIQLICQYYGKTETELGLIRQRRQSRTAPKEDEMQRREALTLLAGGSGLALLAGTGSLSLTREEELTIARTLVGALWRTSLSEDVETVAQVTGWLLKFLERDPGLLKTSKEAAQVAAEGHLIAAIAARHLLQPGERLRHLQEAERYACLAGAPLLQMAVYSYLGYSYNFNLAPGMKGYKPQPETARLWFQRGLAVNGGPTSSAMEATLLMGQAEAHSLLQEYRAAVKALGQAEMRYAATVPANDPGYALADTPPHSVPLWKARIFLNLGRVREALEALEESQRLYHTEWRDGRGLVDLHPQRMAVALALGDQDLFVEALQASIEGIQRSKSRYGQAEVKQLLKQGQTRWPQTKQLSEWEALIE
ncbi:helix-turn-helix domain-containing protein [Thermogemmatispora sp.]|uniref:helix-turn-helix domain-containing protein n=1 Tax=Thermogemmatispora sp. TaxID=1968838 RepID=UPI0035E462B6